MIHEIAARLTQALSGDPSPVLPAASIATRRPASAGELPAVAISVDVERGEELGFGRLVRGNRKLPDGSQTWDDVRGERLAGTVAFEVWAGQSAETGDIARKLDAKLRGLRDVLRERGFALLRPSSLEAMDSLRRDSGAGPPFAAWRQRLAYRFVFEGIEGGALIDGGQIRRVDVDIVEPSESFSTPQAVN